jgi:hypothetical protein
VNYDDEDDLPPELERYLKRYMKRTGVFRMYRMDREFKTRQLLLEFAVRGHVLFTIRLWKRNSPMWD